MTVAITFGRIRLNIISDKTFTVKKIWDNQKLDCNSEKELEAKVQVLESSWNANIVKLMSSDSKIIMYMYTERVFTTQVVSREPMIYLEKVLNIETIDAKAGILQTMLKLPLCEPLIALNFCKEFALTSYRPRVEGIAPGTIKSRLLHDCRIRKMFEDNDRSNNSRSSSSQAEEKNHVAHYVFETADEFNMQTRYANELDTAA